MQNKLAKWKSLATFQQLNYVFEKFLFRNEKYNDIYIFSLSEGICLVTSRNDICKDNFIEFVIMFIIVV